MNLSNIATKSLCEELLRRASHTDALLALVNGAGKYGEPVKEEPPSSSKRRGAQRVKQEEILTVLREAKRPLTVEEAMRQIPRACRAQVAGHLRRAALDGLVTRVGAKKPFAYAFKGRG